MTDDLEDLIELCEDEPSDWSFWFKLLFFVWVFG